MAAAAPAASRIVATTDNIRPPLLTIDQLKVDFAHVEKAVAELETEFAAIPSVFEDEEDLAQATALAGKLIKAAKRCEDIRAEQNRPFLDATSLLNAHFKHDLQARCNTKKVALETLSTAFQRKKAAREQIAREAAAAVARKQAEEAAAKVTEAVKAGDVPAATVAIKQADSLTAFANKASAAAAAPISSMGLVKTEAGAASLIDNWTFEDLDLDKVDMIALRPFFPRAAVEQALRAFIKSGRREIAGARIFNDNKTRFRA